jgi:hypothetical protein
MRNAVLVAVAAIAVWLVLFITPRATQVATGEPVTIGVSGPTLGTGFSAAAVSIEIREERDIFQESGLVGRTPYARIVVLVASAPEARSTLLDESWIISVSHPKQGVAAIRTLVLDQSQFSDSADAPSFDGSATNFSAWDDVPTPISHFAWEAPLTRVDLATVSYHVIAVDVKFSPAVVERHLGSAGWVEGWDVEWAPPSGIDSKEWTVSLAACKSCDIIRAYGEVEEGRRYLAAHGTGESALRIELDTPWRPWVYTEPALAWLFAAVAGYSVSLALALLLSRLIGRGPTGVRSARKPS